jgi:hypothetical protein
LEITLKQLAVISVVWVLLGAAQIQAQVPQVLGVWELDLANSKLPTELFPQGLKSETRSYVQRNDGYLVVLAHRVNGNGSLEFIQVAAKSDARDYPQYQSAPLADFQISGTTTRFTYSEKITGDNTAEVIAKRDGQVINKGTRRISADGKTMTLEVAQILPDAKEIPILLVFKKRP